MLIVVEHIEDGLRVLHLHLLGDVGGDQQLGPGLRHPRELPAVVIETNMDNMCELGRVGNVRLLSLMIF